MYTEQSLIFDQTSIIKSDISKDFISADFYHQGFLHLDNFHHLEDVQLYLGKFIANLDLQRAPHLKVFQNQIQLAKVDRIPSPFCQDAVHASNISLHFDMGLPLNKMTNDYPVYVFTCLYFPHADQPSPTLTRIFDTRGVLQNFHELSIEAIDKNLLDYVSNHGDGFEKYNFGRLTCLARTLEAALGKESLCYMREHRIADWFNKNASGQRVQGIEEEKAFYQKLNIDLESKEKQLHLLPGSLLILDNTRVAHGRLGRRSQQEIFQLMYGVANFDQSQVASFRKTFAQNLLALTNL